MCYSNFRFVVRPPSSQINVQKKDCILSLLDREFVTQPDAVNNVEFDMECTTIPLLVRTGVVDILREADCVPSPGVSTKELPDYVFVYSSLSKMTDCFLWLTKHTRLGTTSLPALSFACTHSPHISSLSQTLPPTPPLFKNVWIR